MSSFLGFGGSSKSDNDGAATSVGGANSAQVEQIKAQIQTELSTAYAQTLVNGLTENCFEKCIFVPGPQMTSVEKQCIDDCASKFMESWNVISGTYIQRIKK